MMVLQWIRSLIFNIFIYVAMAVMAIGMAPLALFSSVWAYRACHAWCVLVRWGLRVIVGLNTEIRGTPPTDAAMIAAKHQSFLDIILIFGAVPRGRFIMKRELMYAPFLGQYALKIGSIPVDRGKRGQAITKMMQDVSKGIVEAGQLIIYPQGTRVAPGDSKKYKVGTGVLYGQLGQTCVPVATNVGHFWPKRGVTRHQGTAIVEFLDPIEPGLELPEFMTKLEEAIETASSRLSSEAGFPQIIKPAQK